MDWKKLLNNGFKSLFSPKNEKLYAGLQITFV